MSDTRDPETDQPLPIPNDSIPIQDLVIADIQVRKQLGFQKYGSLLQAGNGRDALKDAYEEALDLCMYLRQALAERDACKYGDPTCPCQDGDQCHYEGENPMTPPEPPATIRPASVRDGNQFINPGHRPPSSPESGK